MFKESFLGFTLLNAMDRNLPPLYDNKGNGRDAYPAATTAALFFFLLPAALAAARADTEGDFGNGNQGELSHLNLLTQYGLGFSNDFELIHQFADNLGSVELP